MSLSTSLKRLILLELFVPISLLTLGIYHGLMQVIYRSGLLHQASFLKLDYYQGLTLHGVVNAIVLTTFFAVAFGHATIAYYLKREPSAAVAWTSGILMLLGTVLAAWAILAGKASVLYTFYPPLKADPAFYVGTALLIVGSWLPLFDWLRIYKGWKREHPGVKIPIGVLGTLVNFIIWFVCTLAVAYEVLVLLLPWSMGLTPTVNVSLSRTLFWFFGHALVYFWLLPAYIMYYTLLPKAVGGKLYSDMAARIAFIIFLVLSIPIGVHHQFSDPNIQRNTKMLQTILTMGVTIPSFLTAFNMAASMEYAGRLKGSKGLFGWVAKLPWLEPDNYLFGYMICGLILFVFGGFTGVVNASYQLNAVIHNTAWLPGHFHMTVAGPVFLAILGMSLHLISTLRGRRIRHARLNTIVPYLWMIGVFIFSTGLMWGGLIGEPRRTNLGLSYTNPASPQFHPQWVPTTALALAGGIIMFVAAVLFFIVFFATYFQPQTEAPRLEFDASEAYLQERYIPLLNSFKPWVIVMVVVILFAYIPAITNVLQLSGPGAPPHLPSSPLPGR